MELYSDEVLLMQTHNSRKIKSNPIKGFIGTLVEIEINIKNLENSEDDYMDDDIW